MHQVGITERGDAALDFNWLPWVAEGKPAILITKDPRKLLDKVLLTNSRDKANWNIIVHCTITGWGGTPLEPNVPLAIDSFRAYEDWVKLLGKEKVVLRIDPIIPSINGINKAMNVAMKRISRGRLSFLDLYPHVKERLQNHWNLLWGIERYYQKGSIHAKLEDRRKILSENLGSDFEVCGEPGISCVGCVSKRDLVAFGISSEGELGKSLQRKACACLSIKKELLSNRQQCPHGCLYCYWK